MSPKAISTAGVIAVPTEQRPKLQAYSKNLTLVERSPMARALEMLAAEVLHYQQSRTLKPTVDTHGRRVVVMATPLVADRVTVGVLLAVGHDRNPYSFEDQERLTYFADQAALALKNSRLYDQTRQLYQEVKRRSDELVAVLDGIGDAVVVTNWQGRGIDQPGG